MEKLFFHVLGFEAFTGKPHLDETSKDTWKNEMKKWKPKWTIHLQNERKQENENGKKTMQEMKTKTNKRKKKRVQFFQSLASRAPHNNSHDDLVHSVPFRKPHYALVSGHAPRWSRGWERPRLHVTATAPNHIGFEGPDRAIQRDNLS